MSCDYENEAIVKFFVEHRFIVVVQCLVEHGANINKESKND